MRIVPWRFALALLLAPCAASPLAAQGSVLTGQVVDAQTGARLAGAVVDATPGGRSAATDEIGAFRLSLRAGRDYVVVVSRVGYADQRAAVSIPPAGAAGPVTFALTPEPLVLERVEVVVDRFEARRHLQPVSSYVLNRDRLSRFGAGNLALAVRAAGMVNLVPCPAGALSLTRLAGFTYEPVGSENCVSHRGGAVLSAVFIDDRRAFGGYDELLGYAPSDVHHVEVYQRGAMVRVYTLGYVEALARANRRLPPLDWW
jgi:hypothetical protein